MIKQACIQQENLAHLLDCGIYMSNMLIVLEITTTAVCHKTWSTKIHRCYGATTPPDQQPMHDPTTMKIRHYWHYNLIMRCSICPRTYPGTQLNNVDGQQCLIFMVAGAHIGRRSSEAAAPQQQCIPADHTSQHTTAMVISNRE